MKRIYLIVLVALSFQLTAQKLPFQGRLLDGGVPFNGTANLQFSIADPAWSETISGVAVTDGYYSVVLGETTPLPRNVFTDGEATLNISINSTAITPVSLYANSIPDSAYTNHLAAIGVNDEEKTVVSTTNSGYDAYVVLKDSLNRIGGFLQTRKTGGYIQLNQRDLSTDALKSALAAGTFGEQNSFLNLYGGNAAGDGVQVMIDAYVSNLDLDGNTLPGGYRRGGIDLYDYSGNITSFLTSESGGGRFGLHNTNTGDVRVYLDGATGTIDAVTVNQSSDRRLKKDIQPLDNALANVLKLQGVSYTWKDETMSQKNQIGVIAQEVEEIYPEFVHTKVDGYKAVNYAQMTAVLIEAVKELTAKVETLETENRQLKETTASIEQIQKELAQLKELLGHGKAASK